MQHFLRIVMICFPQQSNLTPFKHLLVSSNKQLGYPLEAYMTCKALILFRTFTVRDNTRCSACACVSSPPCVASDSGKMNVFSKSTYILLYIEDSTPLFTGIVQANPSFC